MASLTNLKYQFKRFFPVNKHEIETLYLEVTNRCSGGCIFCSHHLSKRPPQDMDIGLLRILLDRVRPKKAIFHMFGEPLEYPHIVEAVKFATDLNIKSVLDTNGQFLTEGLFIRLGKAGLDRLNISFGATTKDVYESIWRGCNFEDVCDNIMSVRYLKKHFKTRIIIRPIITKENEHQLEDIKKMWKPFCDKLQIVREFHLPGYDRTPLKKLDRPNCKQSKKLYRECVVKSNGDVILCCCDLDGKYIIENVLEDDIMNIWRGERMEMFRWWIDNGKKNYLPDICQECVIGPW